MYPNKAPRCESPESPARSLSLNPSPDWPGGSLPVVLGPYPPKVFFPFGPFFPSYLFSPTGSPCNSDETD